MQLVTKPSSRVMATARRAAHLAGAATLACILATPVLAQDRLPDRDTLRRELLARGYSSVEVETLGRTIATVVVCSGGQLERLQVDRNMRARLLGTLGPCGFDPDRYRDTYSNRNNNNGPGFNPTPTPPTPATPPVNAGFRTVSRDLSDMGFDDILFEDDIQGEVSATACRRDWQYRARYDADGVMVDLYRTGECPDSVAVVAPTRPVTGGGAISGGSLGPRAVADRLFTQGYRRVFVDGRKGDGYEISGCFGVRRFEMIVDRNAVIQARRAAGFCRLGEGDTEYVPPRPISEELLQSTAPLDPPLCQQVLNWLQFNRPLTFESGSARLDRDSLDLLRQMAAGVSRCGAVRVLVEGHTDSISSDRANQTLSEQRAESVARVLVRNGVAGYAVTSAGFGEDQPIDTNATAQGRAMNRRIELNLEWGRF